MGIFLLDSNHTFYYNRFMKQKTKDIIKLAKDIFKFEGIIINKEDEKMLKQLTEKKITEKEYINWAKRSINV